MDLPDSSHQTTTAKVVSKIPRHQHIDHGSIKELSKSKLFRIVSQEIGLGGMLLKFTEPLNSSSQKKVDNDNKT